MRKVAVFHVFLFGAALLFGVGYVVYSVTNFACTPEILSRPESIEANTCDERTLNKHAIIPLFAGAATYAIGYFANTAAIQQRTASTFLGKAAKFLSIFTITYGIAIIAFWIVAAVRAGTLASEHSGSALLFSADHFIVLLPIFAVITYLAAQDQYIAHGFTLVALTVAASYNQNVSVTVMMLFFAATLGAFLQNQVKTIQGIKQQADPH